MLKILEIKSKWWLPGDEGEGNEEWLLEGAMPELDFIWKGVMGKQSQGVQVTTAFAIVGHKANRVRQTGEMGKALAF